MFFPSLWRPFLSWKKSLFFIGVLAALAWPPYGYALGFAVSLNILLIRLWHCPSSREAFWCGWWWGWGFYIATLFWVGNSLWVDAQRFAWFWPLSVLGLPAFFALYPALTALSIKALRPLYTSSSLAYGLCFALMWSFCEFLRGHLFTGFPWNLTAYIWGSSLPFAQGAAFLGSYGLGLVTLVLFSLPGIAFLSYPLRQHATRWAALSALGLAGLYFAGSMRLQQTPTSFVPHVLLRLVQPSLPQKEKGDPRYAGPHSQILVSLSQLHTYRAPTHVIWPEAALPIGICHDDLPRFPSLFHAHRPFILLAGSVYRTAAQEIFNSLMMQVPGQPLVHLYAKTHLLPFGEYIPHRAILAKVFPPHLLKKVTPGQQDLSFGLPRPLTQCAGLPPFRTFICYEAIFPGRVMRGVGQAEWILNLTNDAWFGHSPGPYQHFVSAQFRAIEEGLPLIRVANTGISAVIDPLGRVVKSLPLFFQGVLDAPLPQKISPTLYSQYHDWLWGGLMAALSFCVLLSRILRRPRPWD